MCVAVGFYLPLRIFSCLTALAFLGLLLLDDEKKEKEREKEGATGGGEKGEVTMASGLVTREKKPTREIVEIGGRKSRKKYSSSWTPVIILLIRSNVSQGDIRVSGIIERPF